MSAIDPTKQFQYAMDFLGVTPTNDDYVEWSSCKKKRRYTRLGLAQSAARGAQLRGEKTVHAYMCPFCSGYHIGHDSQRPLL